MQTKRELQTTALPQADQPKPSEIRKKNAWWRQPRENRSVRKIPYVISEGDVWFGQKAAGGRAWVWVEAGEENLTKTVSANDPGFGRRVGR